jgi:flagellar biosynthesis chaperone FliJ
MATQQANIAQTAQEKAKAKEIQAIIDGLGKERDFISKKILGLQKFIDEQNPATNQHSSYIRRTATKQTAALNEYLGTLDELIKDLQNDIQFFASMPLPKGLKSIVERL